MKKVEIVIFGAVYLASFFSLKAFAGNLSLWEIGLLGGASALCAFAALRILGALKQK